MVDTESDFAELSPLINLIGERVGDAYILRKEKNESADNKYRLAINVEQAKKDLKDLDYDVAKSVKASFYKNDNGVEDKSQNKQEVLRQIMKKVYVELGLRHV